MAVSERFMNHRDAPMGPGGTLAAQAPKRSLTLSDGTSEASPGLPHGSISVRNGSVW